MGSPDLPTGMHDFDIWRDLPKLEVPTLFIRGAETDTFHGERCQACKTETTQGLCGNAGKIHHLLPLERPQEVFDIMQSFLKTLRNLVKVKEHRPLGSEKGNL